LHVAICDLLDLRNEDFSFTRRNILSLAFYFASLSIEVSVALEISDIGVDTSLSAGNLLSEGFSKLGLG